MIEVLPKTYILNIENVDEEIITSQNYNVVEFNSYINNLIGEENLAFLSMGLKAYYWKLEQFNPGQEYKDMIDDYRGRPAAVSLKFYINDSYTGGDLYFNNYKHTVTPSKGMLIAHPSSYLYRYDISEVYDGPQIVLTNHFYHANSKES